MGQKVSLSNMISEMSVREKQISYGLSYIWNLKQEQQNQTHRCREQIGGCQRREELGGWEK